jgi:hypothetical protein
VGTASRDRPDALATGAVDARHDEPTALEEETMKKLLLIGTILTGLALAGAAAADTGNGATVANYEYCIPSPLITWCWDVKTTTNVTSTPSGNVSFVTNGTSDYTVSIPLLGCTSSKSEPVHLHWLRKADETQSHSERLKQTNSFTCASGDSYSCTSTFELHETSGDVQFQRSDFVCAEL